MQTVMRTDLAHKGPGYPNDKLFQDIDRTGGWPVGYEYVGFEHTTERKAGFTKERISHGWWSSVASADDYYFWKLSERAKQKIIEAVRASCRVVRPDAPLNVDLFRR